MGENKVFVSWKEFGESADNLSEKINSSYNPDSVVSISRGGDPVGVQLSHYFDAAYGSIRAKHYDGEDRCKSVEIVDDMLEEVRGDVLIADDVADTGKTLEYVTEYLKAQEDVEEVKTATLHSKPNSRFVPDFYLEETDEWIVYPWEQ